MTGIIHFETFLIAGILLNLTPGNDTIFILSKSIAQGKKAGIMSVLGIATGSLIHTTLAALGLSIIIAKSLVVFTIIKYVGAAYLLYIGYKMITSRMKVDANISTDANKINLLKIYRDAVLTNVLNPKVAMLDEVGAHLVEQAQVRALAGKIIVHRPEHRTEAVGVGDSPFGIAAPGAVTHRLELGEGNRAGEEAVGMELFQFADDAAVERHGGDFLRARDETASDEGVACLVHP